VLHKTTVNELYQENEDKKYSGLCYDESGHTFCMVKLQKD